MFRFIIMLFVCFSMVGVSAQDNWSPAAKEMNLISLVDSANIPKEAQLAFPSIRRAITEKDMELKEFYIRPKIVFGNRKQVGFIIYHESVLNLVGLVVGSLGQLLSIDRKTYEVIDITPIP